MVGEIKKLAVINKSAKPHSFRNYNKNPLPVIWKSNKQSWMICTAMEKWLHQFNLKIKTNVEMVYCFWPIQPAIHTCMLSTTTTLVWFLVNTTLVT